MGLRCKLGLHKWTVWSEPWGYPYFARGRYEVRHCQRCFERQRRSMPMTNKPEPNTRPLPQPSELVDLIERLESHMGKQDPQILLADCREAASELRAQSVQIAKLQADGDKLAGALERSRQGWSNVLELGLLPVQHQSTALGLQEAATQALTEWKDRA